MEAIDRRSSRQVKAKDLGLEELELQRGGRQRRLARPCGQADVVEDGLDDEGRRDQCDEPDSGVAARATKDLCTVDPFHKLSWGPEG